MQEKGKEGGRRREGGRKEGGKQEYDIVLAVIIEMMMKGEIQQGRKERAGEGRVGQLSYLANHLRAA